MADYSINAIARKVSYTGSAGVGPYAFSFEVLDQTDVAVYKNATLLTLTTDYTVTVNANGTGSVTLVVAATADDTIVILGARDIERTTDFVTAGDLRASSLNEQLDSLTIFDQQIDERVERSIKAPPYDPTGINMVLPSKADRADKLLKFDTEGNVEAAGAADVFTGTVLGANYVSDTFTGNGSTTVYTLTTAPGSKLNTQVYIDGVYQEKSTYSLTGSTLTFTEAPPLNASIEIISGDAVSSFASDASQVNYDQGSTGFASRTVASKLQEFVSVKDFGAVGDGSTDNTPAFNALLAAAAASSLTSLTVYFPSGTYYFNSQPNDISVKLKIVGDGVGATLLYRNFNGLTDADGLFNFTAGANGSSVDNLGIISATGTSGGCLISLVATASGAPDFCRFSNLYLTSNNSDNWKIYIDGTLRTSSPIGVRDTFITNCSIFGGATGGIYAKDAVALHISDTDTFPAGGTSGKITIAGSGGGGNLSYYVKITGSSINGLDLSNVNQVFVSAALISANIVNASSATDCLVFARCGSTIQSNWTNGLFIDSTQQIGNLSITGAVASTGSITSTGGSVSASLQSGSTTIVGHVGLNRTTACPDGDSFAFNNESGKLFLISTGGGAAALVFADYKQTTIDLISNPSSEFEASSTPTAGKTGIYKSLNSHTINIVNNVGSLTNYNILNLGSVGSTADPS